MIYLIKVWVLVFVFGVIVVVSNSEDFSDKEWVVQASRVPPIGYVEIRLSATEFEVMHGTVLNKIVNRGSYKIVGDTIYFNDDLGVNKNFRNKLVYPSGFERVYGKVRKN